ncbi:MAG TPA: SprB repeat-containing protein, partial [Bacteroidia bacterium]|nr:SprB repeat-containing protein [Bacteroidia bacterium]
TSTVLTATGADAYNWSTGETTSSITVSPHTTTTYTVTDSTGACNGAPQQIIITVNPTPTANVSASPAMICSGSSSTLTASGGIGNYRWSTGATTSAITVSPNTTTTYTLTDTATGCGSIPQIITLAVNTTPTISVTASPSFICPGSSSNLTASGAKAYSWAPDSDLSADTGAMVTATLIGTLTYTVTGMNGVCKDTQSIVITVSPMLVLTEVASPSVICSGQSCTLTAGGAISYNWSPGIGLNSTSGISVSASPTSTTTYTLIGTNGTCLGIQTAVIVVNPTPVIASSQTNPLCYGALTGTATASVSNGTFPYNYNWSTTPAQTTSTATALAAGIYTVTVTDMNSCTAVATNTITQPTRIRDSISSLTDVKCFGNNNGKVTVGVKGGTPGYTYLWNTTPVQTQSTASTLSIGTYTVSIRDVNGCTVNDTAVITQPSLLVPLLTSVNALCNDSNGSITSAGTSGGTPGYSYLWSNSSTASSISAKAGSYTLTVTDTHGCIETSSATINQPTPIAPLLTATPALCNDSNGSITSIGTSGGTPGYSYLWSNSSTASSISAKVGSYTLTVKDTNGCLETSSATINQPTPIAPILTATPALCNDSNGSITSAGTSGGTPGYSYLWSNSYTASSISAKAGSYTVTITDMNGCFSNDSAVIIQPSHLRDSIISTTNEKCFGDSLGSISVGVTNGTPGYSYSWAPYGGSNKIATKLTAGIYTVTIIDAGGCIISNVDTIIEPTKLKVLATSSPTSCNGECNGQLASVPSGGTTPYSYLWNNGSTSLSVLNVCAGAYSITITDSNNCKADSIGLIVAQPLPITATITTSMAHCGQA